jgi:sialate O-acetylesterase
MSRTRTASACPPTRLLFLFRKVCHETTSPVRDVPVTDGPTRWTPCTPKTAADFSGVLYYFGLKLHKELGVPVGLIDSAHGGTAIEGWTLGAKNSGGLYNGMIAPLMPFAIRGVTWYQGESNVGQGHYRDKMEALISGWRRVWGKDMGCNPSLP